MPGRSALGRHDAHGHRLADSERIADREHDIAQAQAPRVAELDRREVLTSPLI